MNLIEIFTKTVDWFESLFHKEYGIRVLYMALLLIPSISLFVLYKKESNDNIKLAEQIKEANKDYKSCLEKNSDVRAALRVEVRKEVLDEFSDVFKAVNEFQLDVILENNKTIEKIKSLESKIKD